MAFDPNDDPFGPADSNTPVASAFQAGGSPRQGNAPAAFGGKTENKYSILNMFWLVNPKAYIKDAQMLPGETHFMAISFNINFGNLRLEVSNMSADSIKGQLICLNKMQRLVSGTVYPSAMFQLVSKIPEVICYEQIINYEGSDWQNKIAPVSFNTTTGGSIVASIGQHVYEFQGWQKEALIYACKFGLNQGMVLAGESVIKR